MQWGYRLRFLLYQEDRLGKEKESKKEVESEILKGLKLKKEN